MAGEDSDVIYCDLDDLRKKEGSVSILAADRRI